MHISSLFGVWLSTMDNGLFTHFMRAGFQNQFQEEGTMTKNRKWLCGVIAGLLAMLISPVFAQEQNISSQDLPDIIHQGTVAYTTGGFGLEDRDTMKAAAKNYNLILSNATRSGGFTTGGTIVILNKGSRETVTVNNVGPLFYAKLPAGIYVISAVSGNEKMERTVTISGNKQERVNLIWSN
jgi:hypothetical protein